MCSGIQSHLISNLIIFIQYFYVYHRHGRITPLMTAQKVLKSRFINFFIELEKERRRKKTFLSLNLECRGGVEGHQGAVHRNKPSLLCQRWRGNPVAKQTLGIWRSHCRLYHNCSLCLCLSRLKMFLFNLPCPYTAAHHYGQTLTHSPFLF